MRTMNKLSAISICFIVIVCVLPITTTASPPMPHNYWGTAKQGGVSLPVGTIIKALGDDGVCYGLTSVDSSGWYSLDVNGDDLETVIKEGCVPGEKIWFWTDDDKLANETSLWTEGGTQQLDLTFDGIQPVMLKINEIMVNPLSGNEWIEVYNPTSTTVSDLSEYRFYEFDNNDPGGMDYYDVAGSGTLAPGEFYVFDITGTGPDLLDNAGDAVILQFTGRGPANITVIDRVEWGIPQGRNPNYDDTILSNATAPPENKSLALQPDGDDNDDPLNDFVILTTPTPGASNGAVNQPPVADAGPDDSVDEDTAYLFNGTGSYDPDGTIVNYTWDFKDGEFGYVENPVHIYIDPGYYEVNLTVRDDDGATSSDTVNITVLDITPPSPPADLMAALITGSLSDVNLTWTASADDGGGYDDVAGYSAYKSITGVNGSYEFAAWMPVSGSASYNWIDKDAGDGDPNDYFYIVRANDTSDNEEQNANKAGKVANYLVEGWNLVSIPLIQNDTSRAHALRTMDGNCSGLWAYHAGLSRPWLHWHKDRPSEFNDVVEINHMEGYYIDIINADSLVVAGAVPSGTQISLKEGWNLVGYPSLSSYNRTDGLNNLEFGTHVNKIMWYNTTAKTCYSMGENDFFETGVGYWFHAKEDAVWNVPP